MYRVRSGTGNERSIQPLSSLLWSFISRIGGERRVKEITAAAAWDAAVGSEIARRTRVLAVKDGRLYVAVETSTWAHQLTLFKAEILSRLNGAVGEKVLRDIRFQVRAPEKGITFDDYEDYDNGNSFHRYSTRHHRRFLPPGNGNHSVAPVDAPSSGTPSLKRGRNAEDAGDLNGRPIEITTDLLHRALERARAAAKAQDAKRVLAGYARCEGCGCVIRETGSRLEGSRGKLVEKGERIRNELDTSAELDAPRIRRVFVLCPVCARTVDAAATPGEKRKGS